MTDHSDAQESLIEEQPTAVRQLLRFAHRMAIGGGRDDRERAQLAIDMYHQSTVVGLSPMRLIDGRSPGIGCSLITPNEEDISHHVESVRVDVDPNGLTKVIATMIDVRIELRAWKDRDRGLYPEKNTPGGVGGYDP